MTKENTAETAKNTSKAKKNVRRDPDTDCLCRNFRFAVYGSALLMTAWMQMSHASAAHVPGADHKPPKHNEHKKADFKHPDELPKRNKKTPQRVTRCPLWRRRAPV